jgi:hypothetical protein
VVHDKLCLPGDEVYIEATLYRVGLAGLLRGGIQGEVVRFFDTEGKPLRDLLTDPSGLARIPYRAGPPGRYPITVRLLENPRFSADPATGNLFVRKKTVPLFFVAVEAGLMPGISTPFFSRDVETMEPEPGSVKALSQVGECHLLVYLTQASKPSSRRIRSWLTGAGYPPGPIRFLDRPTMTGFLFEAPPPETDALTSLWKDRSVPAHLLTRDPRLAEVAADQGVSVLLLAGEDSASDPPPEETREADEDGEEEENKQSPVSIQRWAEVPEVCGCETARAR